MGHLPVKQIDVKKAPLVAIIGFPMNSIIALFLFYNSGVHNGLSNGIWESYDFDTIAPNNTDNQKMQAKLNHPEYFWERNFFYTNQWHLGMFHLIYASAYLSILLAPLTQNRRPLLLFLVYAMLGFCIQQSVCAYRFYYEVWPNNVHGFGFFIKFEEFASFFFYCVSFIVNTLFLAFIFCMHADMKKKEAEEEFQHQKQMAATASTVGFGGSGGGYMPKVEVMTPNVMMNQPATAGAVEIQIQPSISNNCSNETSMLPRC